MVTFSVNVVLIFGLACFFWVAVLFTGMLVEAKYALRQKGLAYIRDFIYEARKVIVFILLLLAFGVLCVSTFV